MKGTMRLGRGSRRRQLFLAALLSAGLRIVNGAALLVNAHAACPPRAPQRENSEQTKTREHSSTTTADDALGTEPAV